ncbi:AI-2E family transporter [Bosea sp. NBC_00550]|uniref:AI-2E family transporter n=1 Tax=Bosea sp. NBC_00550 TaxID=2969621 RepID=UPI0022322031|nr:AI-2E family transporter [Bosea sp. NBC_00550]UZF93756.1 AI-2E family transporter [Bosea sp. NBC_00550]
MDRKAPKRHDSIEHSTLIDSAIRIGLIGLLVYACARIVLPFAFLLIWSAILAVILYPLHLRLAPRLGQRGSALLIGLIGVALMLGPMVMLVTSLATSLYSGISTLQSQGLTVPQPPLWLDGTPLVGKKLTEIWSLVASNLPAALTKYGHLVSGPLAWLASSAGDLAIGELSFVASFAIAAVLVVHGPAAGQFARRTLERITGSEERAVRLVTLTAATIRGVGLGVVGVALIQSLLLGCGFFAIGLPAAGPLMLVALLLGIMQVPLILLTLPVVGYVFYSEATQPAIIFLIWNIVVGLSDNVLRPLFLGRGLEVPMPIILIGVLGGVIVDGLLGLFVGPVLLGVSYTFLIEWLQNNSV